MTNDEREALIEEAAKAMVALSPGETWEDCEQDWYIRDARAALAVFEQAPARTDDEPVAYGVYGRVTGSLKYVQVMDEHEVAERSEFYDVVPLFRRPVAVPSVVVSDGSVRVSDDERFIEEVAEAFQQHEGAPTWKDDPSGRDAALRWHMRGFKDGRVSIQEIAVRTVQGEPGEHGGTIPLYGMLDVWMALYGTSHPEFDEFYAEHGYAEAWARILAAVRDRRPVQGEPPALIECPHWSPGKITMRKGCTACAATQGELSGDPGQLEPTDAQPKRG